jgi:hypothetical protein
MAVAVAIQLSTDNGLSTVHDLDLSNEPNAPLVTGIHVLAAGTCSAMHPGHIPFFQLGRQALHTGTSALIM